MKEKNPHRLWNVSVKRTVVLILLLLLALVVYRFRIVIVPLMLSFLLAFILDPIVSFLAGRTPLSRGASTLLVFLILIAGVVGLAVAAPVTAVSAILRLIQSVQEDVNSIITEIGLFLDQPIEIWGRTFNPSDYYQQLNEGLSSVMGSVAVGTVDIAVNVATGAFWVIFILIASFYLVKDADRLIADMDRMAPADYRDDFMRLRQQVTRVWNAFLRGQLILGVAMTIITSVICLSIGVPYAIGLGLLAGLMEFVPNLGPVVAAIPAVLLAYFQGSSVLPIDNLWFAVIVLAVYLVIQQVEGNWLLPRVLGRSLDLHPLMVLIAVIFGGSMAGILGMLLAAPVVATLRVIGRYVFCRLYDQDPFAVPPKKPAPAPSWIQRVQRAALHRLWTWRKRRRDEALAREQAAAQAAALAEQQKKQERLAPAVDPEDD